MEEIVPSLKKEYFSLIDELELSNRSFDSSKFNINHVEEIDGKLKDIKKLLNRSKQMKSIWESSAFRIVLFAALIIVAASLYSYRNYIFPYFDYDEYCEERHNDIVIIHNKNCPICKKSNLWFTTKENKYNILIKENAFFCSECFDKDEIEILKVLHLYNLLCYERSLKMNGASKEYIKNKVKESYKSKNELNDL